MKPALSCVLLLVFFFLLLPGFDAARPPRTLLASRWRDRWGSRSSADPENPVWCQDYTNSNFAIPRFPEDLARHEESKTEYWWHGGTLETSSGRKFGLELNFIVWNPTECDGATPFMANVLLVVSDVEANRLLNRSSVQPAWPSLGVKFSSVPYDLTMDKDWYVRQTVPGEENWDQIIAVVAPGKRNPSEGASEDLGLKFQMQLRPPFNIHNGQSGFEIDDDRVTPEGEPIGSMHVSQPRIDVLPGSYLFINGSSTQVTGTLWMQHMWLSKSLTTPDKLAYWNWFHFRLSDGWLLEFTYFRISDGSPTPYPNGNLWSPNADVNIFFELDAITFKESNLWKSPKTGNEYYIWHELEIDVPGHNIVISTKPLIDDNEILDPIGAPNCYYEGASAGVGRHNGKAITTKGFSEIIGKYWCDF